MIDIWSKGEVVKRLLALEQDGKVKKCMHLVVKLGYAKAFYPQCMKDWASREPARDVRLASVGYNGPTRYYWPVCPQDCPEFSASGNFLRSMGGEAVIQEHSSNQNDFWSELHPAIVATARTRFEAQLYADAVEASLKEINLIVKRLVSSKTSQEYDGADLMNRAFSPSNPVVHLADLTTQSGQDEQKGYMLIFSGTMTGVRNPKAHANLSIDRERAIHLLFLASLLMFKIDERLEKN
jgi:uncharacterized protein (TIGR02391 family)